ncbi:unnamed protein product [Rotaria sp. Silwood2]|nr:unnamed protein product [Rotaria sp. Silwood2]CAF2843989.1 unnamed protein product [Rotaria sp. Silwood2]CAF3207343.1 unnamed protein product [Rotaria sp. Silwood2]CAF4132170.1 unnamed protein product [Rotaria sp. Silwood2]CAF4237343.1 unnamed protein product [Rotaria sp. Silwood2]
MPHTLLNSNKNQAKVLLINAQDPHQTLPKDTPIGTLSCHSTCNIYATTQTPAKHHSFSNEHYQSFRQQPKQLKPRAVSCRKNNSNQTKLHTYSHRCNEYFLSGND